MAFVTRRHSHFLAFRTPLGGWPICSVMVAYFAPVGRPICSGTPAVLLRNMQQSNKLVMNRMHNDFFKVFILTQYNSIIALFYN
jgi:hypothetical protein